MPSIVVETKSAIHVFDLAGRTHLRRPLAEAGEGFRVASFAEDGWEEVLASVEIPRIGESLRFETVHPTKVGCVRDCSTTPVVRFTVSE